MDSLEELIDEARAEYQRNEMDEPVLLDGTSERHAREALSHLHSRRWEDALKEARVAAGQRDTWVRFLEIVSKIHASQT
jgi:hypothetical protein